MGGGRWSPDAWGTYDRTVVSKAATVDHIYTSRSMHRDLDPKGVTIRESRDSDSNPNSTPIIIGLDVTGSMGYILDAMARQGLKTVAEELYNRKPVTDPHIMFMGIGDADAGDDAPLQVTQFEADIRIAEQLSNIYLERCGGNNTFESYTLPWYFAATHTSIDSFEKRGTKGIIFTIGDEMPNPTISRSIIKEYLGEDVQFESLTAEQVLNMVSKQYDVFHIMVEEGSFYRSHGDKVRTAWTNLLGQRALKLSDHTKLGEVIVSAIQISRGESAAAVTSSWDGNTNLVVSHAVGDLATATVDTSGGPITFA